MTRPFTQKTVQTLAVGGLDADAGVETEPAAMLPAQHILGVVGLQEPVATEVAQHPFSHSVLEALQELGGQGCGFVKTETGGGIGRVLIRVILKPLEEPVHNAKVVVEMGIEAGAEAMEKADSPERGVGRSGGTGLPQGGLKGPEQDMEDGTGGPGPVMEEGAEALGHGKDPLAHGHVGEDMVHQVGGRLGHTLGATGRAGAPALAGEGHQEVVAAA